MSLKAELEQWTRATEAFDAGDYEASLDLFYGIADSAKIHFNIGLILSMLGDFDGAVNAYFQALSLDQYFAIAYFQKGVANMSIGEFQAAMDDFNDAHLYLRGNLFIDYTQIGLDYKLYSCDVLYNRGLCHFELGDKPGGMNDLLAAQQDRKEKRHNIIARAIDAEGKSCPLIAVPKGILYRPAESKVKNSKKVDYLGNSKVVAAMDDRDTYTGFQGAINRKQSRDQSSTPIPQASSTNNLNSSHSTRAPAGANPYKNNQFTRLAGTAGGGPPGLSRSATTIGGPGGPNPAALRGHSSLRRPSNSANGGPPDLAHMQMPGIRRIMTDLPRDPHAPQSAPQALVDGMTDLNLAESQLNQINRRPSFNPAGNPGMPPPRMHRLHSHDPPGQASRPMHRSPSLANRSLPSLGSPTMAGEAHPGGNHAGAYPAHELPNASPTLSAGGAPLLRNGSIAGQHHPGPAFGGDDNASMYDMAPRPKLNVPKGKTAVKIHYHNDIIKLLVDARISYDDLLSKIRAKIAAHLQKAADRSRRPSAASESEPPGRAEMGSPSSLGQAESDGQAGGGPLGVAAGITSWWNGSQGGQPGYGTNQAYLSPPTSSANLPSSPGAQMALATVQNIRVKYRDEDDELVLMTDQEDFEMAKGYMGGDMSCPDTNVVERLELWCEN